MGAQIMEYKFIACMHIQTYNVKRLYTVNWTCNLDYCYLVK